MTAKATSRQAEALPFLANIRGPFDLVLLDPPFHYDTLNEVLPALADKVATGGVVLAESEREAALPNAPGRWCWPNNTITARSW